jgi:hypothetical protein
MQAIMEALFVYVGRLMANMFSQEVKTTLFRSGLLQIQPLLLVVKVISHGSQLYASILGDVMIGTIASAAWARTVDSYCGISA